jgi:hypothetical protein
MKILVLHDEEGNIDTLVTVPADAPAPRPATRTKQLVSEVEVEISSDPHDEKHNDELVKLARGHRVEGVGKAKLVPKQ